MCFVYVCVVLYLLYLFCSELLVFGFSVLFMFDFLFRLVVFGLSGLV